MHLPAKIAEKIKLVWALTTSKNEHEAKSAKAMAEKLAKEYGVTVEQALKYEIGGYLVWLRTPRGAVYQKWHPHKFSTFADTRKQQEAATIKKYALSVQEFERGELDELARLYPCPEGHEKANLSGMVYSATRS